MAVVQLCILVLFVASTKSTSMYNMYSNMIMLDGKGNYNVSYNYNESADTLEFMVQVRTTGWVGFGVAEKAPNMMMYYDVAIGGVTDNGTSYLQDYLTVGRELPRLDTQQDWMLMNATEENNITTIKFYRMRNTTDLQNDTAIPKGMSVYIVWAYHPMSDKLQPHGNGYSGFYNVTLIPVITPTPTIMMAPSTAVVQPVLHSDLIMLDGKGNYNVSYYYNAASDKLEFMVQVRTTGWVGFGVAEVAPNMMNYYDVAIGGVTDNGTSYLQDYLTVGHMQPRLDTQQDWMLMNASEEKNVTTLKFYRMRNTTDLQNDTAIPKGMPIYIVWAYHPMSDELRQHCNVCMGVYSITLVPGITPTKPMTMTPTATASMPVMPVQPNFLNLQDGNYNVSWMYNSSMDTLHFIVEVRATGWIAFGVATIAPNSMMGYDVAIGRVEGGEGTLEDFITEGRQRPTRDNNQQDWKLTYSGENNGITKLKFYRKLNTNDDNDVVIQRGMPIYIVWAYSPDNDVLGQHTNSDRGFQQVTLVPAGVTPTAGKGLFSHSFDNGNFLVRWTFDDQSNKLTFHVKVKTTGWVGFGFAKVAPAQMKNYDVVVGGYDNGGYLDDYYTQGQGQPQPDRQNEDYKLLSASEVGGYTELMFERTTNTDDDQDIQFVPGGAVHIIWAYGAEDVTRADSFAKHSSKGFSSYQLVIIPTAPVPTQPAAASSLHSLIYVIVSIAAIFFNVVEI